MSYAPYFRVKAELYAMLLAKSDNAFDRAWYEGLIRSYNLLAASEDRHYHTGLKAVPSGPQSLPEQQTAELESEVALLFERYGVKQPDRGQHSQSLNLVQSISSMT